MILNTYLNEAKLFIRNFTEWAILLLIFTAFFFSFGLKEIVVLGKSLVLPLPVGISFSAQFFNYMTSDLIPQGVTLIVTNPLAAFIAQIKIALLLSFMFTLPFFLYRLIQYFSPALYLKEKFTILKVAVPSAFLFALGAIFSYFILIPPTFSLLYVYTESIGATPLFTVNEFIGIVLALIFATGIMFLLPVVMTLLSRFGIIKPVFWKENLHYAMLSFLIISAIITPDGSGVTMVLLSIPMAGLYGVGYVFSQNTSKTL
jgi:sec-independent protein translocase protein TatC